MKKISFFLFLFVLSLMQYSCDKIAQPSIIITDLDTNLFPGNFIDYEAPDFSENTNTLRNVLIEDFTGHQCPFCPPAAALAKQLEEDNPGRVFATAIHASPGPGGIANFQQVKTSGQKYTRDFTTKEGREIAEYLSRGNAQPNPLGTINRVIPAGNVLLPAGSWADLTDSVLVTPLKLNIQAESNYYPASDGGGIFIHTQVEPLVDLNGEYSIVIYAIQDKIIDWQLFGSQDIEFYEHHNVHIGNVFAGESFGRTLINGEFLTGTKIENVFSYKIPEDLDGTNMHFMIYVYNKTTDEILQVIEHRF